jgi:hypothetical protein
MSEYDLTLITDTMIIVLIPVCLAATFVIFNKVTSAVTDILISDLIPLCLGVTFMIFNKLMPVLKNNRFPGSQG